MSNANKNVGKVSHKVAKPSSEVAKPSSDAAKTRKFLPYIAAAAVIIVIALVFFLAPMVQQQIINNPPPGQGALPPVSNLMKEESCKFVYGVVMENACTGGLYSLAEVESNSGTKKFCCGKSVNLENEAKAPLPITPPAGFANPPNTLPEVAVQNITMPPVVSNGTAPTILGGDKDAYGCIGSAGYSWCEVKKKCIRSWEENCTTANIVANPNAPAGTVPNSTVATP